MAVPVKVVVLPITGCGVSLNPSGPVNIMFTVTGIFTTQFNSTVQVRVTSDPKGGMGFAMVLDTVTEVGAGTA